MRYSEIIGKVAKELSLPENVVDKAYKAFWLCVKDNMQSLPLKENLNEEDFAKLRTSFNIPSLGKLSCTYERMVGVKKRFNYINNLRKRND